MAITIPTPRASSFSKRSVGLSDSKFTNGVYKFMNASLLSANMSVGFNNTASSLSVSVVEDLKNNDLFVKPDTPSLWAFSLPKGGVGRSIFPNKSSDLQPNGYNPTNTPFYFCGICNSWSKSEINASGKTIDINISDPREILRGVQCLLSGFSLSHNIGTGSSGDPLPRFQNVDNVIDCFGFFNFGMESDLNEFGMPWNKIKFAIESVRVEVNDIKFEFRFTGTAFTDTPASYRLNEETIDIVSLAGKVAKDGGSDLVIIARKVAIDVAVVEFRAIRRTNNNDLTKTELNNFITTRADIVENADIGREFRNEPTSNIIVGDMRNSNYIALPSTYDEDIHLSPGKILKASFLNSATNVIIDIHQGFLNSNSQSIVKLKKDLQFKYGTPLFQLSKTTKLEDYDAFPPDIIPRLLGGETLVASASATNPTITKKNVTVDTQSGSIFPFWGFAPGGEITNAARESLYPFIEPFLPLDHLVIEKETEELAHLTRNIPLCNIIVKFFKVRERSHTRVFLSGDENSDSRPFALLQRKDNGEIDYKLNATNLRGWTRGLPLNTEILRAAIVSEDAFYSLYTLFYPDIAAAIGFPSPNWIGIKDIVDADPNLKDLNTIRIQNYLFRDKFMQNLSTAVDNDTTNGVINKNSSALEARQKGLPRSIIMLRFRKLIYQYVKQYAEDHIGKQFLVCLPKSDIMNRIWSGLAVPTRPENPEIEYRVVDRGYWEVLPKEFDGIQNVKDTKEDSLKNLVDQERQIQRRFMAEDGRFFPMVAIDWKPKGNINFNANGFNKAMFQDLPVSEFRPNKIADGNPDHVFVSCRVSQLVRRPDLALVQLPTAITYDPVDRLGKFADYQQPVEIGNEFLVTRGGISKFLWYHMKKDPNLRDLMNTAKNRTGGGHSLYSYASQVFNTWIESIYRFTRHWYQLSIDSERVMDFKSIIIPLTSNWVSYGPFFSTNEQAKGMVGIDVDQSLVPWNFPRPKSNQSWDANLNAAGIEKLNRSLSILDYVDNANITVAGLPEFGPADRLGFNSNITTISTNFGIGGVKTTYSLATYSARPGTFRKSEYDSIGQSRVDTRSKIINPINLNLVHSLNPEAGPNRFSN